MEPDRGLVVDHGIWWDSNLENDNESWKRLVYIFVDFKPVKYRLKTYETSTDQITDLTLFDERDMVQSLDSKFTHNIEIPKDKETIFTVQIPNEAFSPGIHDVRIVKVHREQDELSFGQTSGEWTFLVKKGDVQSTSKINETTEKVEVIQAPQSVRTPIRSFGILIEEENGISRSGFPPQTSGKPGESVTLDTWMKGKRTKDETEFVRTLVTGGEVVGNGPTRLTLPRFQTSPTGTEVPRVARVSNSVVVPDGNLRAFLFSEPFCREGIILTESWSSNVLRY